jgi:hypothetical protein
MKVGDLVCWKTELLYGIVSKKPMVIVELASLNYDVRVVEPETGWTDWVKEEELHIVSPS